MLLLHNPELVVLCNCKQGSGWSFQIWHVIRTLSGTKLNGIRSVPSRAEIMSESILQPTLDDGHTFIRSRYASQVISLGCAGSGIGSRLVLCQSR